MTVYLFQENQISQQIEHIIPSFSVEDANMQNARSKNKDFNHITGF